MNWFHNRKIYFSLVIIAFLALLVWSKPYPINSTVYLGVGQSGSSYDALGKQLVPLFREHGIDLVLMETSGLDTSLSQLDDDQSLINAGFLTAGLPKPQKYSGLVSLGSIQYSPIWIFYRGKDQASESEIFKKRIAIGADGTNTQEIFKLIAKAQGINTENSRNLYKVKHSEAITMLEEGHIDAVCIVDSFDSPNIQQLLNRPDFKLFNFELADAYTRKLSFLSKVTVPKGSINIADVVPKQQVDLISTTITFLVEEDLHPYIQWLLIKSIKDVSNARLQFFAEPDFFPAHLDHSTPLSNVASQYYSQGFPFLTNYLPLWLAVYLDRMWLVILSALAIYSQASHIVGSIKSAFRKSRTLGRK